MHEDKSLIPQVIR